MWYNYNMKKVYIILLILLIITGCKQENINKEKYNNYINELKEIEKTSENIPLDIEIKIEKLKNNILSYTVLVDRNELEMNQIEAILIHDKESDNIFPSIGIFEKPISLNKNKSKKGIKLTGYVEDLNNIYFKFMIKYINKDKKEEKYYYIYNYRQ